MDLNKGVPTLFAYCEKLIWKIFLKFNQGTCPWMAFAWIFFGIFFFFFKGVFGANHLQGIYSISGLKYFLQSGLYHTRKRAWGNTPRCKGDKLVSKIVGLVTVLDQLTGCLQPVQLAAFQLSGCQRTRQVMVFSSYRKVGACNSQRGERDMIQVHVQTNCKEQVYKSIHTRKVPATKLNYLSLYL